MSVIVSSVFLLVSAVTGGMYYLGNKSQNMPNNMTFLDKKLAKCSEKPNCVSSFHNDSEKHFIAPKKISIEKYQAINIPGNCELKHQNKEYRYYHCKSSLFGFIDDFEIFYDKDAGFLHYRSESRVGHSDLGANRKRINSLF